MEVRAPRKLNQAYTQLCRSAALAVFCATLLCTRSAGAQTDLSGYWIFRVPNGDGTTRDSFIQFDESGETISGTLSGRGPRAMPITGTFKDGQLHFVTQPPAPPAAPPAGAPAGAPPPFMMRSQVYDGTYQDGKLLLHTQNPRQGLVQGVAERTTREATLPPSPLPLPQLKELPDNGLVRTPPMGWNSWNKFAGKVDDASVRAMADAMVSSGMSKAGYVYINIDDTWEGGRDAAGNIVTNRKFPDMKALADYVHSKGLKIGIYSSPGPKTCAGYEGSFGHEVQDAKTYAAWGIDYLKYDLCSARTIYQNTPDELQALYQKMGEALESTGRPIVFSLCEYGNGDVWKWGAKTGGNLWRTTDDIRDNWSSMIGNVEKQAPTAPYAGPGHWNDPDMLEIGNGHMTDDEYRTHMSLWALVAAPLLAGNDVRDMTDATRAILLNRDVIAIDQDPLGKQASPVKAGNMETWVKPLADGSVAVGVVNLGPAAANASIHASDLPLSGAVSSAKDLWSHQQVEFTHGVYAASVPSHGVLLLRVWAH